MPLTLLCLAVSARVQTSAKPTASPFAGPSIVVMLKDGCPCTKECHVELNALAAACRGKIRFVGLLDGGSKKANSLVKDAGLRFPVLPDPQRTAIHALKGHEALDLRLVGKDGAMVGRWDGLSRAHVSSLVDAVRALSGADVALELTPFTTTNKLGCEF